jgi:hypothetical protein
MFEDLYTTFLDPILSGASVTATGYTYTCIFLLAGCVKLKSAKFKWPLDALKPVINLVRIDKLVKNLK